MKERQRILAVIEIEEYINNRWKDSFLLRPLLFLARVLGKNLGRPLYYPYVTGLEETHSRVLALKEMGVVEEVVPVPDYPDEPFQYTVEARNYGHGHDLFSEQRAIDKALGEAVERFLWFESNTFYEGKTQVSSYSNLKADRSSVLDIFSISGFSQEQRQTYDKFFFDEKTRFTWIPASTLTHGTVLCPLSLFSAHFNQTVQEQRLRWAVTTGLATASSYAEARLKSMLELIERDAFMISYLNSLKPKRIDLEEASDQQKEVKYVVDYLQRYNLDLHLVLLPTDFPVHVILAVIEDRSGKGPAYSVGASANFKLSEGIIHATSEALAVRYLVKDKYHNYREDQPVDRLGRLLYWAQPERLNETFPIISGDHAAPPEDFPFSSIEEATQKLEQTFVKKNYELYSLKLSDQKLHQLGYYTTMLFSPDLQPLHLEEMAPYRTGERLHQVPPALGYKAPKTLTQKPHPFP